MIIGDQINYVGRSEFKASSYGLKEKDLEKAIKYIEFNTITNCFDVYSGARAVFGALANNTLYSFPLALYKHFPPFAFISERIYSWVAANRKKLGNLCTVSKPKI